MAVPVMYRADSEHRNAATRPKSAGSPIAPAGIPAAGSPPPLCNAAMRSVAWSPGSSELTVTPSAAISRANVFKKPVTPARAVFERMSVGIG